MPHLIWAWNDYFSRRHQPFSYYPVFWIPIEVAATMMKYFQGSTKWASLKMNLWFYLWSFLGQYDVKKSTLLNLTCSNEYEVLGFAIIEPDLLIVASGSPDVKVTSEARSCQIFAFPMTVGLRAPYICDQFMRFLLLLIIRNFWQEA